MNNPEVIAEWQRRQNKAKKQSIATFFELKKSVSETESLLAAHLRKKETGDIELGVHKDRLNWRLHRQSCHKQPRSTTEQGRQDEKREKEWGWGEKKSYVGSVLACLSVSVQSEQETLESFMKMPALSVSRCSGRNKGEMQTGIACLLETPSFSPCQLWLSHTFQDACGRLFVTFLGVIFIYIPHYALLFVHRALIILRQDEHKQMTLFFDSIHVQFIVEA